MKERCSPWCPFLLTRPLVLAPPGSVSAGREKDRIAINERITSGDEHGSDIVCPPFGPPRSPVSGPARGAVLTAILGRGSLATRPVRRIQDEAFAMLDLGLHCGLAGPRR